MRNVQKHPQNNSVVTVYMNSETTAALDHLCELSGLPRGKVLTQLVRESVRKARFTERTYVVRELTID
jgi:hypothetical protein